LGMANNAIPKFKIQVVWFIFLMMMRPWVSSPGPFN
jgi:hypothetical protein